MLIWMQTNKLEIMKKNIMMFVLLVVVLSCNKNDDGNYQYTKPEVTQSTFTDSRDNYEYKCITVGGQTWMAENFRFIPKAATFFGVYTYHQESPKLTDLTKDKIIAALKFFLVKPEIPAEIYSEMLNTLMYDNISPMDFLTEFYDDLPVAFFNHANIAALVSPFNAGYCETYGALYTLDAAKQFAPEGWRLPTDEDWAKLEKVVGMSNDQIDIFEDWRGDGLGRAFKVGDEGIGFDALFAGGKLSASNGYGTAFYNLGSKVYFWSSSVYYVGDFDKYAITRSVFNKNDAILRGTSIIKNVAYSVRYIKKTAEEIANEKIIKN